MGVLATLASPLSDIVANTSTLSLSVTGLCLFITLSVAVNVLRQLLFRNPNEPPVVFHWFPIIGSTINYGMQPYKFFFKCREKYGDVFTFILLGRKTTVYTGTKGNDFILNGKLSDLNAEDVYTNLTTPVFGKGVVYDCPNAKLMEQKKFVKYGLSTKAFESYIPLIVAETEAFVRHPEHFPPSQTSGTTNIPPAFGEITLYTAARCLQGKEVREKLDGSFADLYHDLDMGFAPVNFILPWFPFPHNRKRDLAHRKIVQTYEDIIAQRRRGGGKRDSEDMIWNLMSSVYKDGTTPPDFEVAHMMIALLMAGQHSSSSTSSWIILRLAQNPQITEELLDEQRRVLGDDLPPLTYDNLQKLPLNAQVVKETLRMHAPIHSMIRHVVSPMAVDGTLYTIPAGHWLLAAPGVTSQSSEFFSDPLTWNPHRWDAGSSSGLSTQQEEEKIDYGYGLVSKGAGSPYLPFGAGRHRCIGEQFAYLQLGAIIATVVRHLRFRNLEGQKDVVATDFSSLFSQPFRPAYAKWERRGTGSVSGSGIDRTKKE